MAKMIEHVETEEKPGSDISEETLGQLARHAEDISAVLELVSVARRSGILEFLKAIMERREDAAEVLVEEATRDPNMRFLRNLLSVYTLLSRVNPDKIRGFMENAAESIQSADHFREEGPLGLLKINSQLKDPDVSAGLRVMLSLAKGFTSREKK